MSHLISDDLLIKSQLLISKFRKQREASLRKQDFISSKYENRGYVSNSSRFDQLFINNANNLLLTDCDSFPQREHGEKIQKLRNVSLNNAKISSRNVLFDYNETAEMADHLSSSDDSVWSESLHIQHKSLEKIDSSVMTDGRYDDYDPVTPLVSVPTTMRSIAASMGPLTQSAKETPQISLPKKNFSNICTEATTHLDAETPTISVNVRQIETDALTNVENQVFEFPDNFPANVDEDHKMKEAFRLFQEEKALETRITQQSNRITDLTSQMNQLSTLLKEETELLEYIRQEKHDLRERRYRIFNEFQVLPTDRDNFATDHAINGEENGGYRYQDDLPYKTNEIIDSDRKFYADKIKNIVDKVIYKEFSNSEEELFGRDDVGILVSVSETNNKFRGHEKSDEECVLSDVMSVKDLNIKSSPLLRNETKTSSYSGTSSITIPNLPLVQSKLNNSRKPPKCRKMKQSLSVDNIPQFTVHKDKFPFKSSTNSRISVHSPAHSVELKSYFVNKSSDSSTESASA